MKNDPHPSRDPLIEEHRRTVAARLVERGKIAAVLEGESGGVFMLFNNRTWQVVGGDADSPSLKWRPELDPDTMPWRGVF